MAGTVTAQTGTFLACFAIAVATASAVTAVERGTVPRGFRTTTLLLGAGVGLAGIPLALIRGGSLAGLGALLGLLVIADLCMVASSEERRVGKECIMSCRTWWSQYH